jgi:hypothetical protein
MDSTFLQKITSFLLEFLYFGIDWFYNAMIDCINAIILLLKTFIIGLAALFPANPCGSLIASCSDAVAGGGVSAPDSVIWAKALQTLAWLMPMEFMANLVGCAMTTVMAYFLIAPLMRWAKLLT